MASFSHEFIARFKMTADIQKEALTGISSQVENAELPDQRGQNAPPPPTNDTSPWDSIKNNPKAMASCCYMLFTCIMWGYDGLASAVVLSIPRWRQDYGNLYNGAYVVPAQWQLAFTAASMIGLVLGGIAAGWVSKQYGQRICIVGGHVTTIAGACLQWYSIGDLGMFFAGKLLTGIPLGVFVTVAPVYCSEVAPQDLRGAMVAAVNFSIVVGQVLAYGVMRQSQSIDGPLAYRTLFAVQWGFAAVGLLLVYFVPESPTRLAARGKYDAAKDSIRFLYPSTTSVDEMLERITLNLSHVSSLEAAGSFKQCFNRANAMRTVVALSVFFIQACSGVSWILGYMGYFMQLSGMQGTEVFDTSLGITGVMAVGNILSWPLIDRLGRRRLILSGLTFCTVCLLLIGVLGCFSDKSRPITLAQVSFMAIWGFMYQVSIGSVGYTLVAEVATTSLRGHTQSLSTVVNGLSNCIWSFALPYMVNPDEANMGGKVAFIFFGILVVSDVFVYFFYPETKGRSFEEIDELYARGIPAWRFADTTLEPQFYQGSVDKATA
ncbi:general substrate transporter [Aspergillus granulosus]|uniref:General substrate transporter n=1 Tax=Aspergillus granulosus TaxID=176169 RepID=A0ABR4H764_9EURO